MSKLEPPSLNTPKSTQAVSDTTIAGSTSPEVVVQDADDISDQLDPQPLNASGSVESDDNLQHLLSDLVRHEDRNRSENIHPEQLYLQLGVFPCEDTQINEPEYFDTAIRVDKNINESQFRSKLKHFMFFSISGKPIYSLNGSDEFIVGYSGLITTIISLFEYNLAEQVKCVDLNDMMITFLSKNPLVLVSVTKIKYEMILDQNTNQHSILINQLEVLYDYLVSILSKPVIFRLFNNRMNYDLRKSLTPLDFRNLDDLATKLTFAMNSDCASANKNDLDYYLSGLLDNSRQTVKIKNSVRSKLNSILLLLHKDDDPDYLFALLTVGTKVISLKKPKTHELGNKDIKNLMLIIQNNQHQNVSEDLWIPICMPNFNSNGFLYCFTKMFDLSKYLQVDGRFHDSLNINVILISTNKNNFYKMQQTASGIIDQIVENEPFRNSLYNELLHSQDFLSIPSIKHYLFKDKQKNQFISSPLDVSDRGSLFKYVHHYTNLFNSKTSTIWSLTSDKLDRKLSYMRFANNIGFMLSDASYEFYCISNERRLPSLIDDTLAIIKYCKTNHKRFYNNTAQYSF